MRALSGQASVEYVGLLALAAALGAALALSAGPPLADAIRNAIVAVVSGRTGRSAPAIAGAADVAAVQSVLAAPQEAMTPDVALLALGRRHGEAGAAEVADALLLAAARDAVPWLGLPRTYRAWSQPDDSPYRAAGSSDPDRDQEDPTGGPVATWVTVAAQRHALAAALAHHTSAGAVALDIGGLVPIPGLSLTRYATSVAMRRAAVAGVRRLPHAVDAARTGFTAIDIAGSDSEDVPAGMRAGDVVVAWPVHRTFWRDGRRDPKSFFVRGLEFNWHPDSDYLHVVFLRPGRGGLQIVAEGVAA